jgi:hypothetical protein
MRAVTGTCELGESWNDNNDRLVFFRAPGTINWNSARPGWNTGAATAYFYGYGGATGDAQSWFEHHVQTGVYGANFTYADMP